MENYVKQLLKDLKQRHDKQPPKVDYRLLYPQYADLPDSIAYLAEWEMAPQVPIEKLFGIPPQAFPPVEKLHEGQMEEIVHGIIELWHQWNISVHIPEGVPIKIAYINLMDFWKNETMTYISEGHIAIDLCEYDISACPWPKEFCDCINYLPPEELENLDI